MPTKSEFLENGIMLSNLQLLELFKALQEKKAGIRLEAKGFSMVPAIRPGDVITISLLTEKKPWRGEVAAFSHPVTNRLFVHRISRKTPDSLLTRGDNSPETDGWIPFRNLLGVVTKVERRGKRIFWPNRLTQIRLARIHFFIYPIIPFFSRLFKKILKK